MGACTNQTEANLEIKYQNPVFTNNKRSIHYLDYPESPIINDQLRSIERENEQDILKGRKRYKLLHPQAKLLDSIGCETVETEVSQLTHQKQSQTFDKYKPSNQTQFIEIARFDAMTPSEIKNNLKQISKK